MCASFIELAQHGSVIHCDLTVALNIGSTIQPRLMCCFREREDENKWVESAVRWGSKDPAFLGVKDHLSIMTRKCDLLMKVCECSLY